MCVGNIGQFSPAQAPPKMPVQTPPKAPVQAPPKLPVQAPPKLPVQTPPKLPVQAPPKAPVQAPPQAQVQAPPKVPVQVPPKAPVQAPPQGPPQAPPQNTPILDKYGFPIANQVFINGTYIRTNKPNQFLVLSQTTNPQLIPFKNSINNDLPNIPNLCASASFNMLTEQATGGIKKITGKKSVGMYNQGSSCFMASGLQFIFSIVYLRETLINNINTMDKIIDFGFVVDPADKNELINAYKLVASRLQAMRDNNASLAKMTGTDYKKVITVFVPNADPNTENDSGEFVLGVMQHIDNKYKEFLIDSDTKLTYVKASLNLTRTIKDKVEMYRIYWSDVNVAKSNDVCEMLNNNQQIITFNDGSDAIAVNSGAVKDYWYSNRWEEIAKLPDYFCIHMICYNPQINYNKKDNNKIELSPKVNLHLALTATNGVSKKYVLQSMVTHHGKNMGTGHYTAVRIYNQNADKYLGSTYNDAAVTDFQINVADQYLDKKKYYEETPYLLLYRNITTF